MIRLSDVVKEYESGTTALKGISLRIEDGEFVFLVGPSGSGKSTIIKLLTGEIVPTSGQIAVNGFSLTNIAERQIPLLRRSVGVIFQDFRLIEKKTVYENLSFAMRAVGSSPREIKKRIPYVLELVGLEEKTDRYPNELSGGEQQRVAIARALINNPSTIIADEPTGNLDPARSLEIMRLLERINHLGTTMVVVTHEKDLVNQFKKRVVTLEQGIITSDVSYAQTRFFLLFRRGHAQHVLARIHVLCGRGHHGRLPCRHGYIFARGVQCAGAAPAARERV